MKLLPVDDARARMLAEITPRPAETVPLAQSIGRVLAEDVAAVRDQPPFAASAMDGWAVRAADTPGALRIVGESAAGHGYPGKVGPGEAVRIFTGAAVPDGCDAMVIQEEARRDGEAVSVPVVQTGHFIRPAGGDFAKGAQLLRRGDRIDPWRLSLAASAGRAEVSVYGRPSVALISTGEEIVEAPVVPGPFQIYDSGVPALAAMIEGWGAAVVRAKPVRDTLEAVIEALASAQADLVVTVGGLPWATTIWCAPLARRWALRSGLRASTSVRASRPSLASSEMAVDCWACPAIRPLPLSAPRCS